MKKGFLVVLLFALISSLPSQENLKKLNGIWEGRDRFVFFENAADDENPFLIVVLKTYYGWYYDRAAEPLNLSDVQARTPNAATHKDPEVIPYKLNELGEAFQITINYSKHNSDTTTFAIVDDKIYLNALTLISFDNDVYLYRGYQYSDGFLMYEQPTDQNITLLIVDGDKYYDVRYWLTDMDYDPSYVTFKYKNDTYSVPKHLEADGTNYSCVNGRSKKVRNTMPSFLISEANIFYNEDKTVMIKDTEPYLTKLTDKQTIEDLMQIINEANARRKPDPEPIFPVKLPKFPGD
ncbi:MAG: hypothetical protein J5726_04860 [Treponema sp.]|nr:hypothetical protein [Treponema sp.]